LLGAVAVLGIGWLLARVAAALVQQGVRRTRLEYHVTRWLGGEEQATPVVVTPWIAEGVFYLLMLFVLVAACQLLGLTLLTAPLTRVLTELLQFVPRVVGAGVLVVVAGVVARVLHFVALRVLTAAHIDERLGAQAGLPAEEHVALSSTVADALYWLVWLLFLPALLDALALTGLLQPVQTLLQTLLGFLPNLFAAALILAVGWFVARSVQRVVTKLLSAVGADRVSEQIGLASVLGQQRLSGVFGVVVYVLILLPVLIAALDALMLEAITRPASEMLRAILQALPALFAALLLLTLGYAVGKVVARLVEDTLRSAGVNSLPARLGWQRAPVAEAPSLAALAGSLTLVAIMLFTSIEALQLLHFTAVASLVSQFLVFAGHVLLGLLLFALGVYLAQVAAAVVEASGAVEAAVLARAARIAILVFAGAMALGQMGIANEMITLAFGLVVGALAVAAAIAFGLGGREVAAREVERWVQGLRAQQTASGAPVSHVRAEPRTVPHDGDRTQRPEW
jgi:hypothetical protein